MASAVPKFNEFHHESDDWEIYEERLKHHFTANSITDNEIQVAILLSSLGSDTYKLVRDLCYPAQPKDKTYNQLNVIIKSQFKSLVSIWRERRKFYCVTQCDGESVAEFYAKLRSHAVSCNFGNSLSSILAHRFVCGISKNKIVDRLCEEDHDQSLEKLIELATRVESAAKEATNGASIGVNAVERFRSGNTGNQANVTSNNWFKASRQQCNRQDNRSNQNSNGFQHWQQRRQPADPGQMTGVTGQRRGVEQHRGHKISTSRPQNGGNRNDISKCKHCAKNHFNPQNCPFKTAKCFNCSKMGHISRACNMRKVNFMGVESDVDVNCVNVYNTKNDAEIFGFDKANNDSSLRLIQSGQVTDSNHVLSNVFNVSGAVNDLNNFRILVEINKKPLNVLIDSGAGLSALSETSYLKNFSSFRLQRDQTILRGYDGGSFRPKGYVMLNVKYKNMSNPIKFYVVGGAAADILGRDWIRAFGVRIELVNQVSIENEMTKLIEKFPEVFTDRLGNYSRSIINIKLKNDASPVYMKHRNVPFAYKNSVFQELDRLEREGVIEPVDNSDWATPLVPVLKGDGKLRLCADYKVTVNKHLQDVKYPLPKIEEIFCSLNKGEKFSKIDLQMAYMQFSVSDETSKILTWNTEKGLYRVLKMPFGLTCSTSIFQREMENIFKNMDFVSVFVDDIVVSGRTNQEHLENLEKVLEKLREANLTVKKEKCSFFQDEIEYLGYTLTKQGLKKTKEKVKAIVDAPQPSNVTEVRSFIGLVNYYHKFVPNAAEILSPIYDLLKVNNRFVWSGKCQRAFKKIKQIIGSDNCIVHFDPNLPIIVTTDASENGIAGTLSHIIDGEERTVACVSRTLQPSERKMSTIMKEALAIYFTVNKFYYYLCNTFFTLKSDHKPLLAIFGEHRGIPQMSANKLMRWAIFLSSFNYKIEYIKGKNNIIADFMSRAPLKAEETSDEAVECSTYVNFTETMEKWPIDNDKIREMTLKDPKLREVMGYVQNDKWPNHIGEELKPYFQRKSELYMDHKILMWGHRMVIPNALRGNILNLLHSGHPGIVRCKSLARSIVFWPGIDKDIEKLTKSCIPCLKTRQEPPKIRDSKWPETQEPFERIHIDFCKIQNKECLIVIDSFSKWLEVFIMDTTTAIKTTEKLREVFARMGLPKLVVSDGGPPFKSKYVSDFFRNNGIQHIVGPPYHPMSNGAAENSVKHFKTKLMAALQDSRNNGISLNSLISRFLINYRNTPHTVTAKSPAEIIFNKKIRTRLTILAEKRNKAENCSPGANRTACKELIKGDTVMVRDYSVPNRKQWTEGIIKKRIGRTTYLAIVSGGRCWKRHLNQIIERGQNSPPDSSMENDSYTHIKVQSSPKVPEPGTPVGSPQPHSSKSQNKYFSPQITSPSVDPESPCESSNSDFASLGSENSSGSISPSTSGEGRRSVTKSHGVSTKIIAVKPDKTENSVEQLIRRSERTSKPPRRLADYL